MRVWQARFVREAFTGCASACAVAMIFGITGGFLLFVPALLSGAALGLIAVALYAIVVTRTSSVSAGRGVLLLLALVTLAILLSFGTEPASGESALSWFLPPVLVSTTLLLAGLFFDEREGVMDGPEDL